MAHKVSKNDEDKIVLFLYRNGGKADIVCDDYFAFVDIVNELVEAKELMEFLRFPVNPTFKDAFLDKDR